MMRRIIFGFVAVFLLAVVAVGQDGRRIVVEKASLSFIPPTFLSLEDSSGGRYWADANKFGKMAMFLVGDSVTLGLKTKEDNDAFEIEMKTEKFQRGVADKYIEGLTGDVFSKITVEKTEFVTVNSLPTVRVRVSGLMNGGEPFKSTLLTFISLRNGKAYYIGWLGSEKSFEELSRALQPTVDSVEFR